jgi:hypothetical protein
MLSGSNWLPTPSTHIEKESVMQKNWWYQSKWHSKMDKSMQVYGMGERTREAYLRSMRQLIEHYNKSPDLITEDELLDYFIHRQNVTGWSPAT